MLIIKVHEGENIDKALKRFKRKFNMIGIASELREREQFTKPSVKKREVKQKAKYRQYMQRKEELGE